MCSNDLFRSRRLIAVGMTLLATATLAGCAPGRESVKPSEIPLNPESLHTGTAISNAVHEPAGPHAPSWWKAYGDPQLDKLVAFSMQRSPTMAIAAARIRQAQAAFDITHADTVPDVTGSASTAGERFSNNYGWGSYGGTWNTNNQLLINADYHLDFWGKRRALLASDKSRVQAAQSEARDAALLLQTSLVEAYVGFASAYRLREVTQAGLECREKLLQLASVRKTAGLGDDMETTSLRSAISDTRTVIAQLNGQIERYGHALAFLAGKDPAYAETITQPRIARISNPAPVSRLPANLLGYRPDVKAARERVDATQQGIQVAKAAFYPDIDLSVFAGTQRLGLNDFLSAGSFAAGVFPALSLPIFDGGRLRGQLKARTADYDAAVAEYNDVLLHALQEAADGVTDLHAANQQYTETTSRLDQQKRLAELQRIRTGAGLASQADVLSADIADLLAQRDTIAADTRVAIAQIALIHALGGTYTSSTPESPQ